MLRISYTSRVVSPLGEASYRRLVEQARRRNEADGITGLLLYDERRFVQAFEGPADLAEACYERICRDERHTDIDLTCREPIRERQFGTFSMAALMLGRNNAEAFLQEVKRHVRDVTSPNLQALFIGFAVLGRGRAPAIAHQAPA